MSRLEQLIRSALEPEIKKLAVETERRIAEFAKKYDLDEADVTVEVDGQADPGVHLSLRGKKTYR